MNAILAAAGCAAGVALLWPGPAAAIPAPTRGRAGAGNRARQVGVAAVIGLGLTCGGRTLMATAALIAGWLLVGREIERVRRRRDAQSESRRVAEFAAAVAAELRVGRDARDAVRAAVTSIPSVGWPEQVAAAAHSGGDVADALARAAGAPGAEDLREVAACWRLAERSGAGLAAGLDVAVATAGERERIRLRVRSELAGVRAGGWLLAGLPLLGLSLGAATGARPWRVLLYSRFGIVLLAVGLALDAAGILWLRRMITKVEALA